MSMSKSCFSSATLNAMFRIPSCVSLSPSRRDNKIGPISEMVVRTGTPFAPNISKSSTGYARGSKSSGCSFAARSSIFSLNSPGSAMLARSPLTSARNTGIPALLNFSAITFKVTVFPVPVAPAIKPCRFNLSKWMMAGFSPCPITSSWRIQNPSLA